MLGRNFVYTNIRIRIVALSTGDALRRSNTPLVIEINNSPQLAYAEIAWSLWTVKDSHEASVDRLKENVAVNFPAKSHLVCDVVWCFSRVARENDGLEIVNNAEMIRDSGNVPSDLWKFGLDFRMK